MFATRSCVALLCANHRGVAEAAITRIEMAARAVSILDAWCGQKQSSRGFRFTGPRSLTAMQAGTQPADHIRGTVI
jgi:hypothetical protein